MLFNVHEAYSDLIFKIFYKKVIVYHHTFLLHGQWQIGPLAVEHFAVFCLTYELLEILLVTVSNS